MHGVSTLPRFAPRGLRVVAHATAACALIAIIALCSGTAGAAAASDTNAVPRQLIVGFKSGTSKALSAHVVAGNDGQIDARLTARTVLVKVREGQTTGDVTDALAADPNVAYVEPNYRVHSSVITNDPFLQSGAEWGVLRTHAPNVWSVARGDGVTVAVLDSGIAMDHPDLINALWQNPLDPPDGVDNDHNGIVDDSYGADWVNADGTPDDQEGHGTHVAGTIAATANDGNGIAGEAPGARVMPLKFLDAQGNGSVADAIGAIDYAIAHGANVINASWGGPDYSQALHDAIKQAGDAGIVFVAAAGNDGANADLTPDYPAAMDLPNIVSVGAADQGDNMAAFSNYGAGSVDLTAPGVDILSTVGDHYESWSGTSMATPHVAGVAAILKSAAPGAGANDIAAAIVNGAREIPSQAGRTKSGGELDAIGAFRALGLDTSGIDMGAVPGAFRLKKPGKRVVLGRGGKVKFQWSRSFDDDLLGYEVYVDGKLKATVLGTADQNGMSTAATSAKIKVSTGKHTWKVVAVDEAGNTRTAKRGASSRGKVAVLTKAQAARAARH